MTRPTRAESRAEKQVNVRFSPEEWQRLAPRIPDDCEPTEYVRAAALGRRPRVRRGPPPEAREIARELARVGNNLNQVARNMNEARRRGLLQIDVEHAEEIEESVAALRERVDALATSLMSPEEDDGANREADDG
jgi:hypothetical protein